MTVCNMTIEAGTRAGLIAPDATTIDRLKRHPSWPVGANWDREAARWASLASDNDAVFDREVVIDAATIAPTATWASPPMPASP